MGAQSPVSLQDQLAEGLALDHPGRHALCLELIERRRGLQNLVDILAQLFDHLCRRAFFGYAPYQEEMAIPGTSSRQGRHIGQKA